jgi:hypothetical protein
MELNHKKSKNQKISNNHFCALIIQFIKIKKKKRLLYKYQVRYRLVFLKIYSHVVFIFAIIVKFSIEMKKK